MADSKPKAKANPVISSDSVTEPVEGVHPARPASETYHSPERFTYKDNPDKPDPSTVAQIVIDPNEED